MTFRMVSNGGNCNGCEWIAAEDRLTANTPAAFRRFMAEYNYTLRVDLHSAGGDPLAAMEFGREFRARRMPTSIGRTIPDGSGNYTSRGGNCYSACAIAYLGGTHRSYATDPNHLDGRTYLGFHQISYVREPSAAAMMSRFEGVGYGLSAGQVLSGIFVAYAVERGVDPRVVTLAGRIAPDDMWVLTAVEAETLNVSSKLSDQPDWRLSVVRGGLALAGPGVMFPDKSYQAGIACVRGRPGWLQLDISIAVVPSSIGSIDATFFKQQMRVNGGKLGRSHEGEIELPILSSSNVGMRWNTSIILPPAAVILLRAGGLSVGYDGPMVYITALPWMRTTGSSVTDAVDLLLMNCPR
jgi:hypothetical protein